MCRYVVSLNCWHVECVESVDIFMLSQRRCVFVSFVRATLGRGQGNKTVKVENSVIFKDCFSHIYNGSWQMTTDVRDV